MPGSKRRSSYKRKRKGFNGTQRQKRPRSDDPGQVTSVFEKGDEIEGRMSSQRQSQTESQTQNIPVGNVAGSSSLSTPVSTVSRRKLDAYEKDFSTLNLSQSDCETKSDSGSLTQYSNCTGPESEEQEQVSGYRLIYMNLMSDAMVDVHECKKGKLLLREDYKERLTLKR